VPLHLWYANTEITDHQFMLLDAFLRWDNFYIMDCTSETLLVKKVVDLGPEVPRTVSDEMSVSFLE